MTKYLILVTNQGRVLKVEIPDGYPRECGIDEWNPGEFVVNSHLVEEEKQIQGCGVMNTQDRQTGLNIDHCTQAEINLLAGKNPASPENLKGTIMKWPEKKEYPNVKDEILQKILIAEWHGWNACLEACKATYEKYKIHACKCNDEGGVRTLKQLDEGLCQCPRCGGIVVFKKESKLVELDEEELTKFLYSICDASIIDKNDIARNICAKFGTPRIDQKELTQFLSGWGINKAHELSVEIYDEFGGRNESI